MLRTLTTIYLQLSLNSKANRCIQNDSYIRKDADKLLKLINEAIGIGFTATSVANWTTTVTTTNAAVTTINNNTAVTTVQLVIS